jgi:trehalose 6-phosphate synthase
VWEARQSASEEARLSLEKLDSPWTKEKLKEFVKKYLLDRQIIMISNREPFIHTKEGKKIGYYIPASGMVTAIDPIMQACGGIWVAHGSGNADKLMVDKKDHVLVPPDEPKYTLKRIWLTEQEVKGYYLGFSNEGMWPLFHLAHTRPIFRMQDWEEYQRVNEKFAQVVLSEIHHMKKPLLLVQDFHLALLPRMIKNRMPEVTIGIFWHIPWVSPEMFSICPWKKEILDGILGADLVGFHTQQYCNNFIESVGRELESLINYNQLTIIKNEHLSLVKSFPISIAFTNGIDESITDDTSAKNEKNPVKRLGIQSKYLGVGVDRMDYTKGILERLKGIEIFLHQNPAYVGEFVFIQIAAPSRGEVEKYRQFAQDVQQEVERINSLFQKNNWKPVILLNQKYSHEQINLLFQESNFCLVTSLHDGMNLVAKEFVAARNDGMGVLILSQFTGAAQELKDALIVNPYNGAQTAEAIHQALIMTPAEQKSRMNKMRETIKNYNIYRWSAEFLKSLVNLD